MELFYGGGCKGSVWYVVVETACNVGNICMLLNIVFSYKMLQKCKGSDCLSRLVLFHKTMVASIANTSIYKPMLCLLDILNSCNSCEQLVLCKLNEINQ